ncbi:2-hydroxy-3-oxopropionate reductase [Pseudonocardia sp. HH130630-07]|uniref:2-hydroxy-3-oxopropionate reductase n=1 Tax=Pseudonocardia sp. HH130630-07 TaxID=1690815 RepID=UPI000814E9DF|nr:2-hydroxy-3-oxopropionate reductase [Pseudonocardia sp. HH130630-07]ANY08945.1 2-hydroxy-3-oxopropionate reductase [Pseudonocardia sp. HH130630-07]
MSSPVSRSIAFVGLGIMGGPMARHLLTAGHDVTGFNRSPEKTRPLVDAGGRAAGSVAEAAENADVIALMLPDSPDVETVLTDGILDVAKPGTLIIDFSTIRPDVAKDLATRAAEHGLRMIDAPVSGGQTGAENATLSIMVGGHHDDVTEARPLLDIVGKTVVHVGPSGAGQTVKAANQLIVAGNIALLAEALVFLEAHGADLPAAVEVLGGGLAGSAVLNQKAQKMLDADYTPGFRIDLHHKDMGIVSESSRNAGVVTPVAALVAQLVAATRAAGDGDLDHSALHRTIARLNGAAQ